MASPTEVTIVLDLDRYLARHVGIDRDGEEMTEPQTIEDVVVEMAARQFVSGLDREIKSEFTRRVREIRDDEIRSQIAPLVAEAVTRSVQETDLYGNPKGEPKTLTEVIVAQSATALQKKGDAYSRNSGRNLVEQFIHDEVTTAFTKELKAAVDQAKAEVLVAVKERGAEVLASTIASFAGTR